MKGWRDEGRDDDREEKERCVTDGQTGRLREGGALLIVVGAVDLRMLQMSGSLL